MLTLEAMEKRRRIMRRSAALGHCVCDPAKPCPCPVFKTDDVCECAGEQRTVKVNDGAVRLTEHVRSAGCASKVSKKILKTVLAGLPEIKDPRVLVGASAGDDAGVILLDETTAAVLTVDVFTPSVDDPYLFGQIAAANSVSDIYAMGATPLSALSIIGFPVYKLPTDAMREILRGGIDKMTEAGIAVIGGHSIHDEEVKCGFAVVGTAPAKRFIRNAGAQPGDILVLTKPLGNGIIAFANQVGRAEPEWMNAIGIAMSTLNKNAAEAIGTLAVHAMTDITGFSLTGHLAEIVKNSGAEIEIDFDALPFFNGVRELTCQEVLPGAVERNRESVPETLLDFSNLSPLQQYALFSPETSGGLLLFIAPEDVDIYMTALKEKGGTPTIIGRVVQKSETPMIRVISCSQSAWTAVPLAKRGKITVSESSPPPMVSNSTAACCASSDERLNSGEKSRPNPAQSATFTHYLGTVMGSSGAIDLKHKKLMALALSVGFKCGPCIDINIEAAKSEGATDAQIAEAIDMGIAFGGASAFMFYKNP